MRGSRVLKLYPNKHQKVVCYKVTGTMIHGPLAIIGCEQCPAGRVFQYRVGLGRVLDKIPGSGWGSGQVGRSVEI